MQRTITTAAALAVSTLAVSLAVASAADRASTHNDQVLLAGLSVAVVLATHLVPALLRSAPRLVLWPVWAGALVAALWVHASFLTASARDAATTASQASPAAAARAQERAAIERALAEIKARPATKVARQLSWTTDPQRAQALQVELAEARRADSLREQLIVLAGAATAAAASTAADPLTLTLADVLGVTPGAIQLSASVLLALLLEVLGMLLWREALASKTRALDVQHDVQPVAPAAAPQTQATGQAGMQKIVQISIQNSAPSVPQTVQHGAPEFVQTVPTQAASLLSDPLSSDLQRLRTAVARGECKPTLASIRSYMRCGQQRAVDLRSALLAK